MSPPTLQHPRGEHTSKAEPGGVSRMLLGKQRVLHVGRMKNICREENEEFQLAAQWEGRTERDQGMQRSWVLSFFSFHLHNNPDVTRQLMKGEVSK